MGKYEIRGEILEPVPIDPSEIMGCIYTVRRLRCSQDPRDRPRVDIVKVYMDSGLSVRDAEVERLSPLYEQFHGVISVSALEGIERDIEDIDSVRTDKIFYPEDFYTAHILEHVRDGMYIGEYDNYIRSLDMIGGRSLTRRAREGAPLPEEAKRMADLFVLTPAREDREHEGLLEINCLVLEINEKGERL